MHAYPHARCTCWLPSGPAAPAGHCCRWPSRRHLQRRKTTLENVRPWKRNAARLEPLRVCELFFEGHRVTVSDYFCVGAEGSFCLPQRVGSAFIRERVSCSAAEATPRWHVRIKNTHEKLMRIGEAPWGDYHKAPGTLRVSPLCRMSNSSSVVHSGSMQRPDRV